MKIDFLLLPEYGEQEKMNNLKSLAPHSGWQSLLPAGPGARFGGLPGGHPEPKARGLVMSHDLHCGDHLSSGFFALPGYLYRGRALGCSGCGPEGTLP